MASVWVEHKNVACGDIIIVPIDKSTFTTFGTGNIPSTAMKSPEEAKSASVACFVIINGKRIEFMGIVYANRT